MELLIYLLNVTIMVFRKYLISNNSTFSVPTQDLRELMINEMSLVSD